MAEFTIRPYGDPVLRAKGDPVKEFGPALRSLGDAMLSAMKTAKGIGLAAPQVGLSLQLFVMNVHDEDFLPVLDGKARSPEEIMPMLLANATVTVPAGEPETYTEGCFPFPASRATSNASNARSSATGTPTAPRMSSNARACSPVASNTSTTIARACCSSTA
jgi:peptide deformylase